MNIRVIKPDIDPKEFEVNFINATVEGLAVLYQHGQEKGKEFIIHHLTTH
ncbi:hypothetical protein [Fischerella sp. JS2]|nr:hypothetical protein [Fischerella sp. JS2]